MEVITIPVVVRADRRLVIDLPHSTPLGPAEVVIRPRSNGSGQVATPAGGRAAIRAELLAAGFLTEDLAVPAEAIPLSADEIADIGRIPLGARPSEDLINEDRGLY